MCVLSWAAAIPIAIAWASGRTSGDAELVIFSGGANRLATASTVAAFERREHVRVTMVTDGCGVLAARMRDIEAGRSRERFPDAFLPCDVSYTAAFPRLSPATVLAETDLVLVVPAGNPAGLHLLPDLARAGLRVGAADPDKSAMGMLTRRATARLGCDDAFARNLRMQGASAVPLIAGVRNGSLDVAVAFAANLALDSAGVTVVPLAIEGITTHSGFAVDERGAHRDLTMRLLADLRAQPSRARYEACGFRWIDVR